MTDSDKIVYAVKRYLLDSENATGNINQGLKRGVDFFTGIQFEDISKLKSELIFFGISELNKATKYESKTGRLKRIEFQKENYINFVHAIDIENVDCNFPIPYERRLSVFETQAIKDNLLKEWNFSCWQGNYWVPLVDACIKPYIFYDLELNDEDYKAISVLLFQISGKRIFQIEEEQFYYEIDTSCFNAGVYEIAFTAKNFKWLIYISHEGTIAFAGDELILGIDRVLDRYKEFKNKWSPDRKSLQ